MTAMARRPGPDHRRADPRRVHQAALRRRPGDRAAAAGRHRAGRACSCPSCPGCELAIDEHAQHKDVYEHTLTVVAQRDRPGGRTGRDFVLRMAALMHDVGKPATKAVGPDGRVSFHHHEVVGARLTQARMKALRYPKDVIADVSELVAAAPALLRVRPGRVDRLGGAPLRHRRRSAARPAAQADPLGLHDPQPAQGGAARGRLRRAGGADRPDRGRGGPGPGAARPRRQRDHGAARGCRRARWSVRPGGTSRSCAWTAARWTTTRRWPSCCAGPPSTASPRRPPDRGGIRERRGGPPWSDADRQFRLGSRHGRCTSAGPPWALAVGQPARSQPGHAAGAARPDPRVRAGRAAARRAGRAVPGRRRRPHRGDDLPAGRRAAHVAPDPAVARRSPRRRAGHAGGGRAPAAPPPGAAGRALVRRRGPHRGLGRPGERADRVVAGRVHAGHCAGDEGPDPADDDGRAVRRRRSGAGRRGAGVRRPAERDRARTVPVRGPGADDDGEPVAPGRGAPARTRSCPT